MNVALYLSNHLFVNTTSALPMQRCSKSIYLFNKIGLSTFAFFIILLVSCDQKPGKIDVGLRDQLKIVDQLNFLNKPDSAKKILDQIRSKLTVSNPVICDYYCYKLQGHLNDADTMNLYADSALAFFTNDSRKNDYPDEYFKSLLAKGDACLKAKKYITALSYYYKGKRVLPYSSCDDGYLSSKIGGIYFNQKN